MIKCMVIEDCDFWEDTIEPPSFTEQEALNWFNNNYDHDFVFAELNNNVIILPHEDGMVTLIRQN
jgi:hypothetical protein